MTESAMFEAPLTAEETLDDAVEDAFESEFKIEEASTLSARELRPLMTVVEVFSVTRLSDPKINPDAKSL